MKTTTKVVPLATKQNTTMVHLLKEAVDWVSIKLTGLTLPFLFIDYSKPVLFGLTATQWLGVVVMLSTLTYNVIRIYKEIKAKS